ncbi:MAG: AAA family ATPase [Planctomycetaceae bacterium]|nr:AAA family ATPase [Planctomycetales bacterium]MCB9922863.1 AAA family ATPase [Planctomycetaceae bacterium]
MPNNTRRESRRNDIDQELLHAETYYWFGMAEQGNMAAFDKGLYHLGEAKRLLEDVPLSVLDRDRYLARIEGLQVDLDEQVEIAHDTLFGVFPLTRFITRSLFAESTILDTFEVIDDPTVMAATSAAKKLALTTITEWKQRHQLDVVFTSVPHNPQLENEALYVFNSHPKYFVHNLREVTDALSPEQLDEFQAGKVTEPIKQRLLDAFGINDLLVVLVRETDVVDDDYFYVLEGKIYSSAVVEPTQNFAVMGFSRDRNRWFTPIIVVNGALLAIAFLAFWLQSKIRRRATVGTKAWAYVVLPLTPFVVGRVTPWIVGPLIKSISPVPETLAIVSFWVPAIAGVACTVVPMTAFWLVAKRLSKIWPVFAIEGRVAPVFVGIAAGFSAFLAVTMFLYLQSNAWFVLIPATLAAFGVAFLFGRTLDTVDQIPSIFAVVACSFALLLGLAVFLSDPTSLWCVAALTTITCVVPASLHRRTSDALSELSRGERIEPLHGDAVSVVDIDQLGELAERPRFQKFKSYESSWKLVEPFLAGDTVHLGLHSARGCGLSKTAKVLSSELANRIREQGGEAIEMHGECPQAEGEPKPYAPFQTALAQHFEIELLGAQRDNSNELDAALGEVFQSVVPFAGVLLPSSSGTAQQASSAEDIAASIGWTLERIAKRKPIVLLIDDVQWLDDASRVLLKHLISRFPSSGNVPIAILVASHEATVFDELGLGLAQRLQIENPTAEEQVQILTGGIGLTTKTAKEVVDRIGDSTIEQGGLFWLLQVVSSLARSGAFIASDQGAMLKDDEWPEDTAVPTEMREVLVEQLRSHPHYRTIIQCAACACNGREFPSSLVAQALDKPKLEVLIDLDRIDQETSILYDVKHRDDIFAFQSSFMLDVVRQELQIDRNHRSKELPQIVREHHARLGTILEATYTQNSPNVYQIANHFSAAGSQYAERGLKYSLEAVETACSILDFSTASYYLQSADECAKLLGKPDAVAAERLYVNCLKAHVTGQFEDHRQAADAGARFLAKSPNCSTRLLLAIAQVHYDAGKSSGQSQWFDRSLEIGYRLIDESRSPQDQASGRHFVGISLPPERADERKSQLRQALEIMESVPEDRSSLELLGRILGALATELSHGSQDDQREARALLRRRLSLIDTHKIGDLRGQAMTHGGLGRLAFFGEPQDLATAKFHFEKDLELSDAINDQQGQIQMHSLLGACALREDDVTSALKHYDRSWGLAQSAISRVFAGAGLLNCYVRQGRQEEYADTVVALLSIANSESVPKVCAPELLASLAATPAEWISTESEALREIVQSL